LAELLTVCGFLLSYLWTRLYLPGEFRRADVITLSEQITILVQQPERDAKAIAFAERQLHPSTDNPPVADADLSDSIQHASLTVRAYIFSQAQQIRKDNWKNHPAIMLRLIPIFQALIDSDPDEEYHRYRAQLGYALKDKPNPDWKGAEAALDKAIEIRGVWRDGWALYKYNRATCKIAQWRPGSDVRLKTSIIDDLNVAIKGGLDAIVSRDQHDRKIQEWMEAEKVSERDLTK
jgi:hypothetical protein